MTSRPARLIAMAAMLMTIVGVVALKYAVGSNPPLSLQAMRPDYFGLYFPLKPGVTHRNNRRIS